MKRCPSAYVLGAILTSSVPTGGLAIDFTVGNLYWTDMRIGHIQSCDLDGSNRRTVIQRLFGPVGIFVSGNTLYWIDNGMEMIYTCDKYTGGNRTLLENVHFDSPRAMKTVRQQSGIFIGCFKLH